MWSSIFSQFFRKKPKVEAPIIILKPKQPSKPIPKPIPKPMPKPIITPAQLTYISPSTRGNYAIAICNEINEVFEQYKGMNDVDVFEETIATLVIECWGFTKFAESLNYSYSNLRNTFGKHRITDAQCSAYARIDGKRPANQQAIANTVYGGEWGKRNLGNTHENDGWNLRGSGAIQATGRGLIQRFCNFIYIKMNVKFSVEEMSIKLRDPINRTWGFHFAAWFISIEKSLMDEATLNQTLKFRKGVNGGYNGLEDFEKVLVKAKYILRR